MFENQSEESQRRSIESDLHTQAGNRIELHDSLSLSTSRGIKLHTIRNYRGLLLPVRAVALATQKR